MDTNYENLKQTIKSDLDTALSDPNIKIKEPKVWMPILGFLLLILSPGIGAVLSILLQQDSLFGVAAIITIVISIIIGFTLFGIFGMQWNKLNKLLSSIVKMDKYYQLYLETALGQQVTNCIYTHNSTESNPLIKEYRNLDFGFNQSSNSGFLDFQVDGAKIHFGRITYTKVVKKDKGSTTETVTQTYFEMQNENAFCQNKLNFYFSLWKYHLDKDMSKVSLESDDFNKKVRLYAGDQIEARKIFTPKAMVQTIDQLENKALGKFEYLFLKDKTAFGIVKPFHAKKQINKKLVTYKFDRNLDKLAENLFVKIQCESQDICDLLSFIKIFHNND